MNLQEYNQKILELDAELVMSLFEKKGTDITPFIIGMEVDWSKSKINCTVEYLIENGLATERIGLITLIERHPWKAIDKVFVEDSEF